MAMTPSCDSPEGGAEGEAEAGAEVLEEQVVDFSCERGEEQEKDHSIPYSIVTVMKCHPTPAIPIEVYQLLSTHAVMLSHSYILQSLAHYNIIPFMHSPSKYLQRQDR